MKLIFGLNISLRRKDIFLSKIRSTNWFGFLFYFLFLRHSMNSYYSDLLEIKTFDSRALTSGGFTFCIRGTPAQDVQTVLKTCPNEKRACCNRWFDYLKHSDSTVRETNILKSDNKLSVYHISCFISVALRRFVEGKICRKCEHCFVQSMLYKAFIFHLL